MIPLEIIDWNLRDCVEARGLTGFALSKELSFQELKIRQVQYSANYTSDHWCTKGHVVYCVEGEFVLELKNNESYIIRKGMSFVVSDGMTEHKLCSVQGALVFIVDGEFLK